jgi:hypothetical protein
VGSLEWSFFIVASSSGSGVLQSLQNYPIEVTFPPE